MNQQPQLSSIDFWQDHERLCNQLLRDALGMLEDSLINANENDLNRLLYRAIIRASHAIAQDEEHIPPVVYEGRNPPDGTDQERADREFKIPDFYWAYIDPMAKDPNDAAKQFVVECKRLADPVARYAEEYVRSGIARFINLGHGYGKGMKSGAMVGYLQEVLIDDALKEVNRVAYGDAISTLVATSRTGEDGAEFCHEVIRPFPASPYRLTHIWTRIGPAPVRSVPKPAT